MKKLPDKIHVSMEGGDCILTVKPSDSLDFTEADYDFIDKQLFPLEEGDEVEYIRKDAFIEKACEYWYQYNRDIVKKHSARAVLGCSEFTVNVESFKKYMEG